MPYVKIDISPSVASLPWRETFLPKIHALAAKDLGVPIERMKSTITLAHESLVGDANKNTIAGHVFVQLFCFVGRDLAVRTRVSQEIAEEIKRLVGPLGVPISTAVYVLEIPKETATVTVVGGAPT